MIKGSKMTPEQRQRLSESHKGNQNAKGNKLSLETRQKMSAAKLGAKNSFYGKTHTPETKKKLSEALTGKESYWKGKKLTFTVWNKGKTGLWQHTPESRQKISESLKGNTNSLGYVQSEETRKKKSLAGMGRTPHNKGKTGLYTHTEESHRKMSIAQSGSNNPAYGTHHTLEHRRKQSDAQKGEKCHLWKGGITPDNILARSGLDYRAWRDAVFYRDNYTCQVCEVYGEYLHADHIKSFAKHPELRYDVNNGRSLCRACHYYITFKRKMPKGSMWGLIRRG